MARSPMMAGFGGNKVSLTDVQLLRREMATRARESLQTVFFIRLPTPIIQTFYGTQNQ